MSGGALTDYHHDLYRLESWASAVEQHNPMLAEMLMDMMRMLERFDRTMSGDTGEEAARGAWAEFTSKWLKDDLSDIVSNIIDRKVEELRVSLLTGYAEGDE